MIQRASATAFCTSPTFPSVKLRYNHAAICMRKGPSKKQRGPSRTSKEKEAKMREIAKGYGIVPPEVGQDLDDKYNSAAAKSEMVSPTVYQRLAGKFGIESLEAVEKGTFVVLSGLLAVFIVSGLAISSEAFFKATGKDVPDNIDQVLLEVEALFTPTIILFLSLSSMFGLYKQSQLSSGATSYSEMSDDGESK